MVGMNPKISILIPVYNGEATIGRAVRSVLAQDETDLEVIVVNDGSTDGTAALLDEIAGENPNVLPIHQKNGGVSKARNTALEHATGEYLMFLDADDELAPGILRKTLVLAKNHDCDIVAGTCIRIRPDGSSFLSDMPIAEVPTIWQGEEALCASLRDHPSTYAVWAKLYRREAIGETRFVEGKKLHEDSFFLFEILQKDLKMVVTKLPIVHYHLTQSSASRAAFSEKFLDMLYFAQRKLEIIEEKYPHLIPLGKNVLVKANMALLKTMWSAKGEAYKKLEKQCQKTIRENGKYFIPAIKVDKILFLFVRLHLFWLYKGIYRLLRGR
ncbi:MAG: glycosyltransferase [Oscillospiraceae bacterium]|nr:glycosyltransferase [Oscillospiraceae bacterium]